jgi:hypothetical protein
MAATPVIFLPSLAMPTLPVSRAMAVCRVQPRFQNNIDASNPTVRTHPLVLEYREAVVVTIDDRIVEDPLRVLVLVLLLVPPRTAIIDDPIPTVRILILETIPIPMSWIMVSMRKPDLYKEEQILIHWSDGIVRQDSIHIIIICYIGNKYSTSGTTITFFETTT